MALKPPASQAPTNATSSVRRNLFHHHLSRRPTGPSTSTSATALQEPLPDSSSDIVIRDINGNYAVQIPLLPPLEDDQVPEDEVSEKEKLEASLIDMHKTRSIQTGDSAELLTAIQSSLRRKVASLNEDNWIFEAENESRN